ANFWANTVSVVFGDARGLRAPLRYAGGAGQAHLATGDLNGDGKPDVVFSNTLESGVPVYLGAGDGTLGPEKKYAAGNGPVDVARPRRRGGRPRKVGVRRGGRGATRGAWW